MKLALVNPHWEFDGSIYFGCRSPHLPLEYGYSKALLECDGHDVKIIDAHMFGLSSSDVRDLLREFRPEITVITTAPTYLFWRCAPPELRVPQELLGTIRQVAGKLVAVGPHGSTTPEATLEKLGADVVVLGECEEVLRQLASTDVDSWATISSICYRQDGEVRVNGAPHASDMSQLPALEWPPVFIGSHRHHHHRFDAEPFGPGAEMEVSRGCPYHCTFCAKMNFRDMYRKRPLEIISAELDGFCAHGVEYVYFIDEIFLPDRPLLEMLAERHIKFGMQTRIDLWKPEMLDLLKPAGCVSIEAGVESISPEGRALLDKNCRLSTDELAERLIYAKQRVPFVQANLLESPDDNLEAISVWRLKLGRYGVWASEPVPLFPYPGSPEYVRRWGQPDNRAWERAVDHYLETYRTFSDIQETSPLPVEQLELRNFHG
jgi:anaerobic magnesium-protoporphyrin IX monomethyl ester cyclase